MTIKLGQQPGRQGRLQAAQLLAAVLAGDLEDEGAELSGVSRSSFYKHFRDKRACLLEAVEALIGTTMSVVTSPRATPGSAERAQRALDAFVELIVAQPAAARMCFVDIYAAGSEVEEGGGGGRRRNSRVSSPASSRGCRPRSCGR